MNDIKFIDALFLVVLGCWLIANPISGWGVVACGIMWVGFHAASIWMGLSDRRIP